jgi:hypothetical protein
MANVSVFDEPRSVAGTRLAAAGRTSRVSVSFDMEGLWRYPGGGADAKL